MTLFWRHCIDNAKLPFCSLKVWEETGASVVSNLCNSLKMCPTPAFDVNRNVTHLPHWHCVAANLITCQVGERERGTLQHLNVQPATKLLTTPNMWRQQICNQFHLSFHVNAKHRMNIVWFPDGRCIFRKVGEWVTRRALWPIQSTRWVTHSLTLGITQRAFSVVYGKKCSYWLIEPIFMYSRACAVGSRHISVGFYVCETTRCVSAALL